MGHSINYVTCENKGLKRCLKEIYATAFDPMETCSYHGNMTIHDKVLCKNLEEAEQKIREWDNGWYSDHAVRFKNGRKINWLIKYEYHC